MPVGPQTISANEFERRDPPPPASLTNTLGIVHDHLDDMLIESPIIAAAPSIVFVGHHAGSLARVEIGDDLAPDGHRPRGATSKRCSARWSPNHRMNGAPTRASTTTTSARSSPRAAWCSQSCDDWRSGRLASSNSNRHDDASPDTLHEEAN